MSQTNRTVIFTCSEEELFNKMQVFITKGIEAANKNSNDTVRFAVDGLTEKPIYTAKEVCLMLNVTRQSLHMWMKKGIIPKRKIGSRLYFFWEDIKKLLEIKNGA